MEWWKHAYLEGGYKVNISLSGNGRYTNMGKIVKPISQTIQPHGNGRYSNMEKVVNSVSKNPNSKLHPLVEQAANKLNRKA